jgi:hypothetical protein
MSRRQLSVAVTDLHREPAFEPLLAPPDEPAERSGIDDEPPLADLVACRVDCRHRT